MRQLVQNPRTKSPSAMILPDPTTQPGCVLIRTRASLISSGTELASVRMARASLVEKARRRPDLVRQVLAKAKTEGIRQTWQKARHRLDEPLCPGYSSAGVVTGVGEGVIEYRVGDRVAAAGQNVASHAEMINVPVNLVCHLPESASFEDGAFVALGAIALHGIRTTSPAIGETVVVLGLGLIGQLTTRILLAQGCRVIAVDPSEPRRAMATAPPICHGVRPDEAAHAVAQATEGRGADSVIVCASSQSEEILSSAGNLARDRAVVTVVGAVPLIAPRDIYYRKELELRVSRSYGPGRYDTAYEEQGLDYPSSYVRWTENRNMKAFLDLIADGRVNTRSLITHRFDIADADSAYHTIEDAPTALAVVFEYPVESTDQPLVHRLVSGRQKAKHDTVGLGLLGAGRFAGSVLAPILAQSRGIRLTGVASRSPVSAERAMRQHGFAYSTCDTDRLIKDPETQLLVIATPHHLHAQQAMAALSLGKTVFLEKPMATSREELRVLASTMAAAGPCLQAGFNRRFAPGTKLIREAFADVRTPKTLIYRIAAGPAPTSGWMADPMQGGRIIGELCHFVDTAQCLIDSWPRSVHAEGIGETKSDGVVVTLCFSDRSVATIVYATDHNPKTPKEAIEMFGGGVSASIEDFRRTVVHKNGRTIDRKGPQDKGHRAQFEALFERLRTEDAVAGDPLAAICATDVTFAVLESLQSGSTIEVAPWM